MAHDIQTTRWWKAQTMPDASFGPLVSFLLFFFHVFSILTNIYCIYSSWSMNYVMVEGPNDVSGVIWATSSNCIHRPPPLPSLEGFFGLFIYSQAYDNSWFKKGLVTCHTQWWPSPQVLLDLSCFFFLPAFPLPFFACAANADSAFLLCSSLMTRCWASSMMKAMRSSGFICWVWLELPENLLVHSAAIIVWRVGQ